MPQLRFGPLAAADLPALAALDADAPDPWSAAQIAAELQRAGGHAFTAFLDGAPVGFACFSLDGDTAFLETVAVAAACRGRGVGGALLGHAFAALRPLGARRCLLEVRCSNAAARALYRRLGFAVLARRPGLYSAPREDGETMALALDADPR